MHRPSMTGVVATFAVLSALLFAVMSFARLAHPLLWHDEALTVVFGERVLDYGYPKVHGTRSIHYPMHHELSVGIREGLDAYVGSPWAQYYVAALGAAWARGVEDPYAKTWRLRLPFALAGWVGLAVLLLSALGALEGSRRRWLFATLFLLALAYSVLLVLHLREARYYALCVLLVCLAAALTVGHRVHGNLGTRRYTAALAVVVILLFNTFYLAFAGLTVGLAVFSLSQALGTAGSRRERLAALGRDLLPLLLAAVAIAPLAAFYDVFAIADAFATRYTDAKNAYANKLPWLLAGLLRYEFLGPALLLRLVVAGAVRTAGDEIARATRPGRRIAHLLTVIVACSVPIVAMAPFYYERYAIALSPLITLAMLLDAFALRDLLADRPRSAWRVAAAAACAAGLVANLWVRAPEFAGRLTEIRTTVAGPLDHVIPYLLERHEDPADLVIATNYEEPSLRYYLGSWVVVGWFNPEPARALLFEPDVIIPRPGGLHRDLLKTLAARGRFEPRRFPIRDVPANNVPSLAPWNHARWVHRFETPSVDPNADDALVILERAPAARSDDPPRRAPGSGEAPAPSVAPRERDAPGSP